MYDHISQFEPMLPAEGKRGAVLEQAHELQRIALQTHGLAHADVMAVLAPLLRKMNSYYTNQIEGQNTLPAQIDAALKKHFSSNADVQRKQRITLAHMEAEVWAEHEYGVWKNWRALLSAEVIRSLHEKLFSALPPKFLVDEHGMQIVPGALRTSEVTVGRHTAPTAQSVPLFLQRFEDFYKQTRQGELAIVAVAAMHHRLAWIHPFSDGNGRAVRLHSHLLFTAMDLTNGVWSPLRGLARTRSRYYATLANADAPRRGDLDGRGNLTEQGLIEFIHYFLDVCIDQASFMTKMLNLSEMKDRIAACLAYESQRSGSFIKLEALLPMDYMFSRGSLERGQFKQMTGLSARAAERCLKGLLDRELLTSNTPKGALRFGLPLHALRFYFPALWPEAEAEAAGK